MAALLWLFGDVLQAEKLSAAAREALSSKDDQTDPMTQAEFLAGAWKLANAKARELEWIV